MKYGTIGSGAIVDLFIESAKTVDNAECTLVYSRDLNRAQAFAHKHGVSSYCDNLDDFFKSECIDTVYIASPNGLHFEQARQALMAKKNVILEKPVCASVEQYQQLMNIANDNGVYIVEAITNAHCGSMKYIENNLDKLGNIRCINANFSQYSSRYDAYKKGIVTNVFDPCMEGGALVDIGIYNLYICVHLFGMPKNIEYIANIGFNGIDTSGCLILQYARFFACLLGAKDCYAPNYFTIEGEDATLLIDEGSAGKCHHVSLLVKGKCMDEFRQDNMHMAYEINDFVKAFENNDSVSIDTWNQETLQVLEVMETARKKAGILFEKEK